MPPRRIAHPKRQRVARQLAKALAGLLVIFGVFALVQLQASHRAKGAAAAAAAGGGGAAARGGTGAVAAAGAAQESKGSSSTSGSSTSSSGSAGGSTSSSTTSSGSKSSGSGSGGRKGSAGGGSAAAKPREWREAELYSRCGDTCGEHANNGVCDEGWRLPEGGAEAVEVLCDPGTDCTDCGIWPHMGDPRAADAWRPVREIRERNVSPCPA